MKYRRLGDSGLQVSEIGIGCNNFGMRIDQDRTTAVVRAAMDAGITLFDTADVYGATQSEVMFGTALQGRRNDIVLATMFGIPVGPAPYSGGGSRRYVVRAIEAEILPACERFGLGMLPFFPLASGLLTGKYHRGEAPPEGTRLAA